MPNVIWSLHRYLLDSKRPSNCICAGGGVFQLQRILGHADISTTRHYVSLYNSGLKKDYDALCPLDNILK